MSESADTATPAPIVPPDRRMRRWHWGVLLLVGLYCHGFLLTNDGVHWDGWYLRVWLRTGNWGVNHEFFSAVGMPLFAYVNWAFAWLPDPVAGMMLATVACLIANGLLAYELGWQSGWLTPAEALGAAVLGVAYPMFLTAQDIIMFFFIFTLTLCLASTLAAVRAMDAGGGRAWAWRGLALAGLFTAGSNAGLLVFQGATFALLFACGCRRRTDGWRGLPRFLLTHVDFLLLPAATWWFRHTFTPQFGAYATYNAPQFGWEALRFGFEHYLGLTRWRLKEAIESFTGNLWPGLLAVAVLGATWRWAPAKWAFQRGAGKTRWWLAGATLALLLGILPYIAAGKTLSTDCEFSRFGLLMPLPAGLLLFGMISRLLTFRAGRQTVLVWPVTGLLMLALGRQYFLAYATERAQWVQSRALLELLAEDPLVRSGSYIFMGYNSAVSKQVSYSTYALGGALGGPLTKFVSGMRSKHGFTTPDSIEYWMIRLSGFPPREFLDIPPAGSQVNVVGTLAHWPESDAALVRRYLWIKWFGQPADWVELRAQLAKIESRVTREAVPLSPAPPRPKLTPSSPEEGDFINGLGQTMIRLRSGIWAGKYEVTQTQYEALMAANPSQFRDPARPVECVSWHEAREFCRRLTAAEARAGRLPRDHCYSLPTETRWRELATGARLDDAIHNPRGERWHTAPVGTLGPNPQGLHDTWGNVWEWCLDWADRPRHFRLLMGEAWHTERPGKAVTDARHFMRPDQAFWNTGFRCVLVPKSSLPAEFQE